MMFKTSSLDLKTSGILNALVADYLSKDEKLRPFYSVFPDKAGFADILKAAPYQHFNRTQLSGILLEQSKTTENTSEATLANIHKLAQPNTFTVTTGHQLCLFTGPLYFIYKIFSTINLAETLKNEFPSSDFVPVYWMASEDHDFEEVNHFYAQDKKITWKSAQTGAVGSFATSELKAILPQVEALFGKSERADELKTWFETAYLKHKNLADATRYLVNVLFGEYGIVIVDGDDKAFKHQFIPHFKKDLFEHTGHEFVMRSAKALEALHYNVQVNPREINCFFIEPGLRARIEKAGEKFILPGTPRSFTKDELLNIVEHEPEKISPNVVLRPLYQQVILPNLAYVGGPGELAYWLELKAMFDESAVFFPALVPRNFVTVVNKNTHHTITKLKFTAKDFFKPSRELVKELQVKEDALFDLAAEKEQLEKLYASITAKTSAVDQTLSGSTSAELKRALNGFDRITGKTNRAIRRRYDTEIRQIEAVRKQLFPGNVPQERYENFSSLYLLYGRAFFEQIKEKADPFVHEAIILTEEDQASTR